MNYLVFNLFSIQQNINTLLIQKLSSLSAFSFITALIGGIFTSISPCVVSSIPVATVYLNQKRNKLYHTFTLFAGISTSLIGIGLLSIFIKKYTWAFLGTIPFLWPILFITMGLIVLNIIPGNLPLINENRLTTTQTSKINIIDSYLLGILLGVTMSPCSTPITITLFAWITSTQKYIEGFYLLCTYTIGYILPLLILIISFNNLKIINLMSKKSYIVTNIIGCMTLTTGSYSLFRELLILL
uniref:Thiol:disulfi de interchange protein n=1 Tax=Liagora harveyana TaxID=406718 RepID=A0A1G4NUX7_9FLOR|nr:Thiol:disulfi de interchange protein [Liagora harveyana]SCW22478.1 Thiol:disulfi de interchange protein [Liagora harveyana]